MADFHHISGEELVAIAAAIFESAVGELPPSDIVPHAEYWRRPTTQRQGGGFPPQSIDSAEHHSDLRRIDRRKRLIADILRQAEPANKACREISS
jgi:hypothetical protein